MEGGLASLNERLLEIEDYTRNKRKLRNRKILKIGAWIVGLLAAFVVAYAVFSNFDTIQSKTTEYMEKIVQMITGNIFQSEGQAQNVSIIGESQFQRQRGPGPGWSTN